MHRPEGITVTTTLLSLALIATVPIALAGKTVDHLSEEHGMAVYTLHSILIAVIALALVGGLGMVLWFYYHGRNWARWSIIVLCLICFIPLRGMPDRMGTSHIRIAVIFYRAVVAVLVLLYSLTSSSRRWFAAHPSLEE
jgi:hypothetical protein